ncbi:hypothetical protein [Oceanicaulis sp. MMSF_3324]|uniref:hypothetical protein n=1 Tax=Oceanicaulis sp. MMSF_3324 TaxID=3046702 RepID=UPI0027402EB7|nr:hypothetical protein [Oceanicaulis sp. MMSF_3324]
MIDTDTLHLQWALSYPFPRPQTPFIFLDGATWPLMQTSGGFGDWIIDHAKGPMRMATALGEQRLSEFERGAYHAVAAVGSNAAPAQLRRKFRDHLDDVAIPVIQISVPDHVVAYANRIAVYGSIPATLVERPSGSVRVWATLLTARDYAIMNGTEDRGEIYDGVPISPIHVPEAIEKPFEAYACLTGSLPLRVSAFPSEGCSWPVGGQWEAQAAAIRALELDLSVDHFVLENTADAELRLARDLALSKVR